MGGGSEPASLYAPSRVGGPPAAGAGEPPRAPRRPAPPSRASPDSDLTPVKSVEYIQNTEKLRNSLATSRGLLPLRASLRQPGRPRVLLTSFSRGGGPAQPTLCLAQKKFWRCGRREPRQLSTRCRPDSIDLMDPLMVRWATGDPPKPPHRVSNLPPLARIRRFERLCKPGLAKLTTNALHRLM